MSHLHALGIVHGDIKDENIMVDTADLRVNIIDLGSAAREDGGRTRSVCGVDIEADLLRVLSSLYCGSETYSSPEVLAGGRYWRIPQEIWSLGVLSKVSSHCLVMDAVSSTIDYVRFCCS